MAYGLSNGHVTDDVTWPPKVLWGSAVGYPSDSLASCFLLHDTTHSAERGIPSVRLYNVGGQNCEHTGL